LHCSQLNLFLQRAEPAAAIPVVETAVLAEEAEVATRVMETVEATAGMERTPMGIAEATRGVDLRETAPMVAGRAMQAAKVRAAAETAMAAGVAAIAEETQQDTATKMVEMVVVAQEAALRVRGEPGVAAKAILAPV
jgi:hypothetical protein